MAIEFSCPHCGKTLRVPDEHLGKKARCPSCQEICLIGTSSATSISPDSSNPTKESLPFSGPISPTNEHPQVPSKNPYSASMSESLAQPGYGRPSYMAPHRGAVVLTLGILALLFNCMLIPGILAWVFGNSDLKQMKAGMMDPEGQSLTQVGMILGMIGTLLPLAMILIYVLFLVVFIIIGLVATAAA